MLDGQKKPTGVDVAVTAETTMRVNFQEPQQRGPLCLGLWGLTQRLSSVTVHIDRRFDMRRRASGHRHLVLRCSTYSRHKVSQPIVISLPRDLYCYTSVETEQPS